MRRLSNSRPQSLPAGPCLGVYSHIESSSERPFGEQTKLFVDLTRLGRQEGVDVVVLTPGFQRAQQGWRYIEQKRRWIRESIPNPDVVIRRSGAFPAQVIRQVAEDLMAFKVAGKLHTLPRICGNKWSLYQVLRQDPYLSSRIPATEVANSAAGVVKIVAAKRDVYVKPLTGAQGVGIFHLLLRGGSLGVTWERKNPLSSRGTDNRHGFKTDVVGEEFTTTADFARFWQATKLQRCLVQDTVQLPRTALNEPFDFRWLVQNRGQMAVVARVARVGQVDAVTTNIHTGARGIAAEQALASASWAHATQVIDELDKVALTVARRLQSQYGQFAEVGVDMAVQEDGNVYVFEANPTPGRRMLRSLTGNVREMSLVYLLEYARRVTGYDTERR
ncbi:MAG: hypothetical protein A2201_03670 [Alicyclobacillus sp. RIFOXYA1_FULL_53_8]|nr:MAG: hypothetical protein A2201_03670 [Alicyclobacillus sp. RIFOXYA1_FULL_53_8]